MQVLTVNQVFELLLNFHSSNNWQQACEAVVPSRKKVGLALHSAPPCSDVSTGDCNEVAACTDRPLLD
jgi:hypothetical protein